MVRTAYQRTAAPLLASCGFLIASAATSNAQDFDLPWTTPSSGADLWLDGGQFMLSGTFGQADTASMSSASFELVGGFWNASIATPCAGDLNGDRRVTVQDLADLLAHFAQSDATYSEGDIDGNGLVNLQDLAYLLAGFGADCPR